MIVLHFQQQGGSPYMHSWGPNEGQCLGLLEPIHVHSECHLNAKMHRIDKHSDPGGDEQGPTKGEDTQKPILLSMLDDACNAPLALWPNKPRATRKRYNDSSYRQPNLGSKQI